MSVRFLFAWYDLWVGAFWDARGRRLYILPLPMLGVVIQFPPRPRCICYQGAGDTEGCPKHEFPSGRRKTEPPSRRERSAPWG